MSLSDTVEVGQIWRAFDRKTERFVRVESIDGDHYVNLITVVRDGDTWKATGRHRTRAQRARFNGRVRSTGYGFVEAAPRKVKS